MRLVKSIITKNPCYTDGRKITVKGLMLRWMPPAEGIRVHPNIDGLKTPFR